MATEKKEEKHKHLKGRSNWEKLNSIRISRDDITERDKKVTLVQYCTIIYHWLRANKNVINILDFYDDDTNKPFLYSIDEVQQAKNQRIIKLLEQRIINAALNKEINATFAALLLQNHYGWTKEQPKVELEVNQPIKFEFDN